MLRKLTSTTQHARIRETSWDSDTAMVGALFLVIKSN